MAALECSQARAGATHLIHPPITLGRDKTLKCFWTVCNILPVGQALYFVRDLDWELFYTVTNQNLIEMISADYTNTAVRVRDEK